MNVRKRGLALLMCICMIFTLLPFSALADETAKVLYVDANKGNDTTGDGTKDMPFATVEAAVVKANSGDTIQLGEGNYTLYKVDSKGHTKGKSLTFVGMGADKTAWNIGAEVPDPANYGTEYNGDYSFDGAGTITFKNMTLRSGSTNYLGFIRADKTVVENCTLNGKTFYWGYKSAEFNNCTFNCPTGDYAIWTYSSPTMSFNNCTFNSSGKVINVYTDFGAGKNDITVNYNSCKVVSSAPKKAVLNINDSNMGSFKYILNITGDNVVNGLDASSITCSRLFGFSDDANNSGRTDVNFGETTVWKDGKMVDADAYHTSGVMAEGVSYTNGVEGSNNSLYTDGYKDNAITETTSADGKTVTKTCQYCGWTESYTKQDWNINVSKTATNLKKDANGDYKTNVTLSVPGVEESLATDVVFVLDKSTSAALEEKAIAMLDELKEQAVKTGAKVKVGVVIFNKVANVTPLTDISTTEGLAKIEAAIKQEIKSGTNTHAGLLAGKELLDNDTGVAANRKHLIFVSDGITYMYNTEPTVIAWNCTNDGISSVWCSPECYQLKYGDNTPPADWATWLNNVEQQVNKLDPKYEYPYGTTPEYTTPFEDSKTTANSVDKALYLTYKLYQEIKAEGYNCYASLAESDTQFAWGPSFMNMLAGGETLSFDAIQNKILYAVDKGSYVKDVIGDKFELFDLEPDHNGFSSLKLHVGEKELTNRFILANTDTGDFTVYYFADDFDTNTLLNEETNSVDEDKLEQSYRFKVEYNVEQKLFTWTFGEAVSNFAPVQLSYTLKLTKPETRPGTYGQLDLNGNGYIEDKDGKDTETKVDPEKALYTNNNATLTPVDSNGKEGVNKDFPMPSVEYTVRNPYRPPVNPGIGDEIIVEITGNSDSVVYDGTEHSVKDYTVKISDPRYTEADFTFTGKAEASGVNAGTYEMGLKAEQFKNTNARFTNVKFVIKADGVLTITPKELIITAGSKTEYGPTPVTCDEWTVSGLVAGDKVESVKITGIQSVPGSSPNVPSDAVIKNAKGEDVTKNYAIKYVNGTLTMLEVLNKEDHFNYIIGTPEGLSLPTANVTRAEVATIFFRLMTDDARAKFDSLDNNFSDVAKGQWYNRAISTLANAGIIKGDPAGTYRPGDAITRAEMATIIARFGDFKEGGKTFNDISGHWAQKYIELAASNGWINGNPDGTFKPNNNITRAETVAMINRVLDRQTKDVSDLLPVSQMTNWSDNMDTAKWYYRDMQEATNNHKAERVGNSIYEKWTEKLPDIDWASYQI